MSKLLAKKEVVYFCIVLLITKCMRAEIKGDEKLLIDLEWPNVNFFSQTSNGGCVCYMNKCTKNGDSTRLEI